MGMHMGDVAEDTYLCLIVRIYELILIINFGKNSLYDVAFPFFIPSFTTMFLSCIFHACWIKNKLTSNFKNGCCYSVTRNNILEFNS